MKRWVGLVIAVTVCAPVLAGCGESDQPKQVAVDFTKAAGEGKGAKACSYLSPAKLLRIKRLRQQTGQPKDCATYAVDNAGLKAPEAKRVTVQQIRGRDGAAVEVRGSGGKTVAVLLVKQGDTWKVSDFVRVPSRGTTGS